MYLKALEIQGFKSFPEKTRLTFERDVTAIVGPNGSGKSNIADAILWVLGEQRTKTLRGAKMEDVIFGGTAIRAPMGYAEVSLILDNSAHIFETESSEVELTRRYYRSGDSEYFINREQVRLKDLNGLLMDTGLGRDGYSVIGQGRIAEIVSTKSTDRREVFDEAAGISRYRYRKEEAERRLEKTDDNLLRINDKIEELEMQVGPLKHQSEVAKKFLVLRDDLRVREVSAWMTTLDKLHERADAVNLEFEQTKTELEKAKSNLESLYAASDSITERMHRKDEESESARERLSGAEAESAECQSAIDVLRSNIRNAEDTMDSMRKDLQEQESRSAEIRSGMEANDRRISQLKAERKELEEKLQENNNILSGCRMKIDSREGNLERISQKATEVTAEAKYVNSRMHMLREMEKEYEGFSKAVKTVMKENEHGILKGIHGPVANLLRTDDDYALAIETALGAASQNVVVDTRENAKSAIELLKRRDAGRATFLPLDTIRGDVLSKIPESEDGFVGLAYRLVTFDRKYDAIFASLLGKTVVVETLSDAIRISRKYDDRYRLVSLDGQQIHVGGSMTGGSSAKGTGVISRANELEKLKVRFEELEREEANCSAELEKAKQELSGLRYQLNMALEDRNELSASCSSINAEEHTLLVNTKQLQVLLDSISGDTGLRQSALERKSEEIKGYEREIEKKQEMLKAIGDTVSSIKKEIAEIAKNRLELEGKRSKTETDTKTLFEKISNLEHVNAKNEQKKMAADLEEKQIIDKLWDNYELSHSAAQAIRQPVDNLNRANREISDLRREISALGTPNLGAIEEYDRVKSRYDFLTEQRDDVEKAKSELLGIIRDVTAEMKTVFLEQFRLINEEFIATFTQLFNGGKASLKLEDETDVLGCGIEINVQPPGKALTSISLLSGGEMAFVAIALYFAILKVRPTPFCVMDEIEAALDEANVDRFADYMRKMSEKTQFIVITHRRGTMEEADMLYGVTMQEKGVSSILQLDLEQAKENAEG